MPHAIDSNSSTSNAKLRLAKIIYLLLVSSWTLCTPLFVITSSRVSNYAITNSVWYATVGICIFGFGLFAWRKTSGLKAEDDLLIGIAEHVSLSLAVGHIIVFMLMILSMGFAYEATVVCPILFLALAAGIIGTPLSRLLSSQSRENLAAAITGSVAGGVLQLAFCIALLSATVDLRGEVTNYHNVFHSERQFDLQIDILVSILFFVPVTFELWIIRFATRFRAFLLGLGGGAMIVALIMAGVSLL